MLRGIGFMMTIPTGIYIIYAIQGERGNEIFHSGMLIPFLVYQIPYHAYLAFKSFACEQSLKVVFVSGVFSGIIFTLAGRIGVIIAYLLLSKDRQFSAVWLFFIDYWQIYLGAALFGGVCMSIKPIIENIHGKNSKPN
jgi:hypothetical protein